MADTYLGIPGNHVGKDFDKLLELAPLGAMSTATSVVELGGGLVDADVVLSVAVSTGANSVALEFATDSAFTTPVAGPSLTLPTGKVGQFVIPFRNAAGQDAPFPFIRLKPTVGGTLTAGAFIAKK